MKQLITLLILMASFSFAQASRLQKLTDIFEQFNRRYSSGRYVKDKALLNDFITKQEALAASLKSEGALRKVLFIENDYEQNLSVTVYALIDEQNSLLGVFWDKSVYANEEERGFLRFASLDMVANGLKFVPISGENTIVIKGGHFTAAAGGTLQFNYLKDFQRKSWGSMNLFLQKKKGSWGIYTDQLKLITQGLVQTWKGFLNGGVKDVLVK